MRDTIMMVPRPTDGLHSTEVMEPGMWWGCEYPERPYEQLNTAYDFHCAKCRMKARTDIAMCGDIMVDHPHGARHLSEVLDEFSAPPMAPEGEGA